MNGFAPANKLQRGNRERFESRTHDQQFTIAPQSIDQSRDRFRIGSSGKDYAGAAEFLQRLSRSAGAGVNEFVCAKLLASGALSCPRPTATVRKPICRAY